MHTNPHNLGLIHDATLVASETVTVDIALIHPDTAKTSSRSPRTGKCMMLNCQSANFCELRYIAQE